MEFNITVNPANLLEFDDTWGLTTSGGNTSLLLDPIPTPKIGMEDIISPSIRQFSDVVVKYVFPVIIIIGSVGNGLSFLVLVRKRLRGNSLYFYLMVLTLADTLVLYVSCLKTWVRALTGFELLHVSAVSCKIIMFILLLSMHMAAWLVVLVTFDRFVSVWFPFRAATICTARRARVITACLLLAVIALDVHVFWTIGLHANPDSGEDRYCRPRPDDPFMQQPFEYLKLATYSFIPFGAVFALNLGIIYKITRRSTVLRRCDSIVTTTSIRTSGGGSFHSETALRDGAVARTLRQQRVIYMLLTLSFSWLILTAPYAIVSVIITAKLDMMSMNSFVFWKTFAFLTLYLNHAINFYLYCITGRKFRQEFYELFTNYFERWRRHGSGRKSIKTAQTPLLINLPEVKRVKPHSPLKAQASPEVVLSRTP